MGWHSSGPGIRRATASTLDPVLGASTGPNACLETACGVAPGVGTGIGLSADGGLRLKSCNRVVADQGVQPAQKRNGDFATQQDPAELRRARTSEALQVSSLAGAGTLLVPFLGH
ncbi:hypothetical protein FALBO_7372 [Fusarium albosuccineum]|uniref:Uncharacterized protein n=1 Tax=Fusarium albosuccineum TaxID=1237068 RepID=A0A8H4LDP4_9HYPO|nr:hypothetical protein FALBO_7372 [Fusarium albosuccineum]